jgi:hypothetical protein
MYTAHALIGLAIIHVQNRQIYFFLSHGSVLVCLGTKVINASNPLGKFASNKINHRF